MYESKGYIVCACEKEGDKNKRVDDSRDDE